MLGDAARSTGSTRLGVIEDHLVRAGHADERAFAELYDRTAHRVYGLVLRVVGDPQQAEEVTQEAFLEIWRTSATFDPARGSALGWMIALAHRRAVDRVRADTSTGTEHPRDGTLTTPDGARTRLHPRSVPAGFEDLPNTGRRAVELAYFGGYTHADVSRLLQVPLDATMTGIRTSLLGLSRQMGGVAAEST